MHLIASLCPVLLLSRKTVEHITPSARTPERPNEVQRRLQVKGDSARIAEWLVSMWGFP